MDVRIAIIAPFASLLQTAREVVCEQANDLPKDISVVLGDMGGGVVEAQRAVASGAEVIVSRGGTATVIAKQVEVPVIQIQVTALDIMRALKQVVSTPGIVGVAGFKNVVYECEQLGDLLGISLKEITFEHESEFEQKLAAASAEGIKVIIGDATSVKLAPRYGLQGILIQSGKDAVYKALREAELVAQVRRKEQARSELLRTIIDASADGIIAVDEHAHITIFNPMAEDIFQLRQTNVIGCSVQNVIPNTRLHTVLKAGTAEIGEIQHIGNKVLATKRIPIKINGHVVGAVASFQDVTQLQRFEQSVRQKLYAKGLVAKVTLEQIVGQSSAFQVIKSRVKQYALTDSTVLITGESGTGKEMLAQSLHNLSTRAKGPFVAINCAAVPENLLESELFGYEEGAFTGAKKGGKLGMFELAHGGTLFLDEIGEMPLALQARILRVLQEKEVMRLGGDKVLPVDVRVVAATNQNLVELVTQKRFRNDLYYRLDILRLHVPPLRERQEDIPLLAEHFLHKFSKLNVNIRGISEEALYLLKQYQWPGNIRELANIMERTVLLASGPLIQAEDIREALAPNQGQQQAQARPETDNLAELERRTIERVIMEEQHNYTRAATRLGINRTTLWRKLRAMGDDIPMVQE